MPFFNLEPHLERFGTLHGSVLQFLEALVTENVKLMRPPGPHFEALLGIFRQNDAFFFQVFFGHRFSIVLNARKGRQEGSCASRSTDSTFAPMLPKTSK